MNTVTGIRIPALLAVVVAAPLHAQVGDRADLDRSDPPPTWQIPAAPVLSAEESMRRFDLPPGFRVEVVAAEPLVQDPVSVTFDERGRAWVIEWPGYNWPLRDTLPGLTKAEKPKSRVVILEDTDGDGRMDKRTVFMDGMDWARGVQPARDGALVLKLPQLVFARDRDGDGVADHEEVLVDGLEIAANPWVAQADLVRLLDNRVYGSRFPWRLRDNAGTWEKAPHLSTRGQWGVSQDNFGRLYYASNTDHLIGDLVPGHYFTRNPNYTVMAGVDVQIAKDQRVWPHAITPGVNRRGQVDEHGRLKEFTANTGPAVYRGDQFGPDYVGNVFLGDVAGRLIRRDLVTEKDGHLTAANAYAGREFLFSHDERFRPVYTANGPDGALYVVDMYRGIIEGYLFLTSYLRKQILARKLEEPFRDLGRIYRIVRSDRPVRRLAPPAREDVAAWVERLADPNGFWRDTAQRIIVERGDRGVVPALRTLALEHGDELARLHALWTLEGLGAITPAIVERALVDSSFRVRQAALRVAEPLLAEGAVAAKVIARMDDDRIEVRRQLLFTLGEGSGPAFAQTVSRVLQRDADQPGMLEAALSGLRDREAALLERLLAQPGWQQERPGYARVFAALAQAVMNSGRTADLEALLTALSDAADRPGWMRLAVLDGLAGARVGRGTGPVARLTGLEQSADPAVRLRAEALRAIWSAAPAEPAGTMRPLTGPVFERGQTLFAICGACHGPEGKGLPGVAPALAGSKVVAESPDELIRSVLFGRNQDRKNPAFPDMPPFNGLGDDDVAAVVSYVRAQWGGVTRPLNAAAVRKVREAPNAAAKP
ncbi:MAG: c-type cytochrome [Opitutaceae bacterium]|nr:c-type cytochrome [Opitutaceae bacterium]